MNVSVTLAGYTGRWRFREEQAFSAWVASRPWDEGGAPVAMVRMPSGDCGSIVIEGIIREARAHEPDASRLRVQRLEARGRFDESLRAALEVPTARTETERLRAAGRVLGNFFWVILVAAGEDGPAVRDDAQEFLEGCAKVGERPSACVVVLHEGSPVSGARDFSVGSLADGVLQESERGQERLWRAFVASRIAWEAAGDLGLALEIDRVVGNVGLFGEEQLEGALNGWATRRVTTVGEGTIRTATTLLLGSVPRSRSEALRLDSDLRRDGLLWRPVGERRSRPAPWLARGLLHQNQASDARHVLRAAMVNGPLANEILRRCFDLESALVASLWRKHGDLRTQLADAHKFS